MRIDTDHEHQQQREVRILLPTRKITTYEAYARADAFPGGNATPRLMQQVCFGLADARFEIKKGNPKVVVLKTQNETAWKKIVEEGVEVIDKGETKRVSFKNYATKEANQESDLIDIYVTGVPKDMSVLAIGCQLAAHIGSPATELIEGCTRF